MPMVSPDALRSKVFGRSHAEYVTFRPGRVTWFPTASHA